MLIKDKEASEWRKGHKAEVERQIQRFLDKAYRKSKSRRSAENKYVGVAVFCGWLRKLPVEILDDIKTDRANPYRLLDDYVTYLVNADYAPHAVKNHLSAVKKWLRFEDVEISTDKLKDIVDLPRQYAITSDRIPKPEELRDMVVVSKLRGKALLTMLASSGMRIGEALSLRVGDISFDQHPTLVQLKAEVTKDRQKRYCFVSDEATAFLREYLGPRMAQKEWFVFLGRHQGLDDKGARYQTSREALGGQVENRPISYWDADFLFATAIKNAGLAEKDDHGRDVLHIHCLRKFFFTRMLAVLGREITEALMGHKEYLDSAYRRYTMDELGKHYLKAMEAITVVSAKTISREEMAKQIELGNYKFYVSNSKLAEPVDKLLGKAIARLGRRLTQDEELAAFRSYYEDLKRQEDALLEEGKNSVINGTKKEQRLVSEDALEKSLQDGWTFIAVLPSGKVLVQK